MKAFFIEVNSPRGWVRMNTPYQKRETAASWRKFVKAAWHATQSRIVEVELVQKQSEARDG